MLAGAAGIMAQLAMQQTMDEITDYLATIDEKVDDVLRAQKDAVLARHDRSRPRDQGGHERPRARWAGSPRSRGRRCRARRRRSRETQAYALRQLDELAEKIERKTKIGDLAKTAKEAEAKVQEWLAVLARCFQLQDAIAVLELDRVLDASPDELDRHRLGLRAARQNRLELISRSTERLLARMDAAAGTANSKVLLHPTAVPGRGASRATMSRSTVVEFHGLLGIECGRESSEARRWVDAAAEAEDKVRETGADERRCRQAPRWRNPRPGQIGDGQALQRDRRASTPSAQGQREGLTRIASAAGGVARYVTRRRPAELGGPSGEEECVSSRATCAAYASVNRSSAAVAVMARSNQRSRVSRSGQWVTRVRRASVVGTPRFSSRRRMS